MRHPHVIHIKRRYSDGIEVRRTPLPPLSGGKDAEGRTPLSLQDADGRTRLLPLSGGKDANLLPLQDTEGRTPLLPLSGGKDAETPLPPLSGGKDANPLPPLSGGKDGVRRGGLYFWCSTLLVFPSVNVIFCKCCFLPASLRYSDQIKGVPVILILG